MIVGEPSQCAGIRYIVNNLREPVSKSVHIIQY